MPRRRSARQLLQQMQSLQGKLRNWMCVRRIWHGWVNVVHARTSVAATRPLGFTTAPTPTPRNLAPLPTPTSTPASLLSQSVASLESHACEVQAQVNFLVGYLPYHGVLSPGHHVGAHLTICLPPSSNSSAHMAKVVSWVAFLDHHQQVGISD